MTNTISINDSAPTNYCLEAIARRLDRDYEEEKASMEEWRITTNAALERIDKKLDYLMKGRGDSENA
jgi:hypothetical protein